MRLQFCCDLPKFVAAARNKHQIVMITRKQFGEFISNPARSSSDENG
jgi:hypothetical protein